MPNHISVFLKPHFWAENDSKWSPEVVYESGCLGERWQALGIERVKQVCAAVMHSVVQKKRMIIKLHCTVLHLFHQSGRISKLPRHFKVALSIHPLQME